MYLDAEFSLDHFSMSGHRFWPFTSRHDSAPTAPEVERLFNRSSMPFDEFGGSRTLAKPCVCVETGCESDLEGVDESEEPIKVKFEASGSKG